MYKFLKRFIPMMDANGSGGGATGAPTTPQTTSTTPQTTPPAPQSAPTTPQTTQPTIDYAQIDKIIEGKLSASEDSVLRGYFKQQGLSREEVGQAIAAFKEQKAANQPDVNAIQQQAQQAEAAAKQATIERDATVEAIKMGIDVKTVPYVLKLADLSNAIGQDGKIDAEGIQTALKKVIEDVPALKPDAQQAGGFKIGAVGDPSQQNSSNDALMAAFGL